MLLVIPSHHREMIDIDDVYCDGNDNDGLMGLPITEPRNPIMMIFIVMMELVMYRHFLWSRRSLVADPGCWVSRQSCTSPAGVHMCVLCTEICTDVSIGIHIGVHMYKGFCVQRYVQVYI